MEEQVLKVSYSASNGKTVAVGEFEVTIYEGLKGLMEQVTAFVSERIDLEEITSFSIRVK